jgi:hypothetical protein
MTIFRAEPDVVKRPKLNPSSSESDASSDNGDKERKKEKKSKKVIALFFANNGLSHLKPSTQSEKKKKHKKVRTEPMMASQSEEPNFITMPSTFIKPVINHVHFCRIKKSRRKATRTDHEQERGISPSLCSDAHQGF